MATGIRWRDNFIIFSSVLWQLEYDDKITSSYSVVYYGNWITMTISFIVFSNISLKILLGSERENNIMPSFIVFSNVSLKIMLAGEGENYTMPFSSYFLTVIWKSYSYQTKKHQTKGKDRIVNKSHFWTLGLIWFIKKDEWKRRTNNIITSSNSLVGSVTVANKS